jgi:hypothetical protein
MDAALDQVPERRPALTVLRRALADAGPALADRGGLVDPATLERVGIARTTTARRSALRVGPLMAGRSQDVLTRAAAGLAAGGLILAGLEMLGPTPGFSTGAAAAAAAVLVAALPRIGWLIAAGAFTSWLGWNLRDGTALVVGMALACVPVLAPRAGRAWSLPALAPLLGVAALGPAFVAVAGFASTTARRAGLAAGGFLWLAFAELIASHRLLFGPPLDAAPRASWQGSFTRAASDAVLPLISSPVLLGAIVWGLGAALLPVLVRGRSMALDVAGATLWATLLVVAHRGVAELAAPHLHRADARGAVVGAILGAFAAVGAREAGLWRSPQAQASVP